MTKKAKGDTLLDDLLVVVEGVSRGASARCRSALLHAMLTCARDVARRVAAMLGLGSDDFVQVLQTVCGDMGAVLTEEEQERERLAYLGRQSLAYTGDSGVGSDGSGQIDEDGGGMAKIVAYRKDRAE